MFFVVLFFYLFIFLRFSFSCSFFVFLCWFFMFPNSQLISISVWFHKSGVFTIVECTKIMQILSRNKTVFQFKNGKPKIKGELNCFKSDFLSAQRNDNAQYPMGFKQWLQYTSMFTNVFCIPNWVNHNEHVSCCI